MARGFEFEGTIFYTLDEFLAALPKMGALEFSRRSGCTTAFCGSTMAPQELHEARDAFWAEWEARFGVQGVEEIDRVLEYLEEKGGGWWYLTAEAALALLEKRPAEDTFLHERTIQSLVEGVQRAYSDPKRGFDNTRVLVYVTSSGYIGQVTALPSGGRYTVMTWYNGNLGWKIAELHGSYRVYIPDPGTIPFQRICELMRWNHSRAPGAVALTWIFAAGDDDALQAADDALSGRKNETMGSARAKVRAALA